jgi:hypothetical protein
MATKTLHLTNAVVRNLRPLSASVVFVICLAACSGAQDSPATAARLPAEQIVSRLATRNQERAVALRNFTGTRNYHLLYSGFPGRREADMAVSLCFDAPNTKQFTIISQTGSAFMINKVLKRLLQSEKEASTEQQRARTALTAQNYDFELLGQETVNERPAYLLRVIPKLDHKFLYKGKVWVDANDFAVAKIEAEPAKRPSFWISKTKINHLYTKVGEFWLPAENKSTTDVRLGGAATLTISYTNYDINQNRPGNSCAAPPSENFAERLE